MPLYELEEGGMRKFYRIEREGTRVLLHWGRIGTSGQRKVLELADERAAETAFEEEKLRRRQRGYLIVHDETAPHDTEVAHAEAGKKRLAAAAPLTTAPRFLFVDARRGRFVWLEQRGAEVWTASGATGSEAEAEPTSRAFASPAAAAQHQARRVNELLAKGYTLDAFDAKASRARPARRARAPNGTMSAPAAATPAPTAATPTAPAPTAPAPRPTNPKRPWQGQRWAFFGEFAVWPAYHGLTPEALAARRGATITETIDARLDVAVFGDRRGTGRAEAKKLVGKHARLEVLDEAAYRQLVRIDLTGKRFAFTGGFDCSPAGLDDGLLARMVEAAGAVVTTDIDDKLDYLVIGNRRAPGKLAVTRKLAALTAAGAPIAQLDEDAFLDLVRLDRPARAGGALDLAGFVSQLYGHVNRAKLGRALDMLRSERFQLYARLDADRVVGVVRSQSGSGSVYASWLDAGGRYGCAQPDLSECMGLQGTPCKHLMVLVVGLAQTGQLALDRALAWLTAAAGKAPRKDTALCAETFLQYKGAEAGEVDWRPTETIPEDFYAV